MRVRENPPVWAVASAEGASPFKDVQEPRPRYGQAPSLLDVLKRKRQAVVLPPVPFARWRRVAVKSGRVLLSVVLVGVVQV